MDRKLAALLLIGLVPASSVLGLARPMLDQDGWNTFVAVWRSNLWGDLVFTGGTVAAAWAVAVLGRRWATRLEPSGPLWLAMVPLSFMLHWAVYAFAWAFTGNGAESAPESGRHFFDWTFARLGDAWGFTFQWGWIGLLFCAVAVPLIAYWIEGRSRNDLDVDGPAALVANDQS